MNRWPLPLLIGSILLPLGGGNDDRTDPNAALILQASVPSSEPCSDQPDAAIATFEDANLAAAVRTALTVGPQEDLTCGLVSGLTRLDASEAEIESLVGIQNLTSLTYLNLWDNSISDISALGGLTSLTSLGLRVNSISDISALSGLTSLWTLYLGVNSITDIGALSGLTSLTRYLDLSSNPGLSNIQPLLDNTGLGPGDTVRLTGTNVSCADVTALRAKGVTVISDCP